MPGNRPALTRLCCPLCPVAWDRYPFGGRRAAPLSRVLSSHRFGGL